jgi:phosphatidate cytidylyltransferase
MKRVFTALVLVPILIAVIGYAPPPSFLLLVAGATILALEEFYSLAARSGIEVFRIAGHGASLLLLATFYRSATESWQPLLILAGSCLLFFALGLRRGGRLQTVLSGVAATILGLLYISAALGLLLVVHGWSAPFGAGRQWIFFLLMVVWFGDTGAYYVGCGFGRQPLAPLISPNKTLEGALGGLLGNVLAMFVAKQFLLPLAPWGHLACLSILLGAVSQVGDLSESALKRGAGMKDSSNLLPGHGGMLDRIDGVLFASPVLFAYLQFVPR